MKFWRRGKSELAEYELRLAISWLYIHGRLKMIENGGKSEQAKQTIKGKQAEQSNQRTRSTIITIPFPFSLVFFCFHVTPFFEASILIQKVDVTKATGPSSATIAAQHEMESFEKDAEELDKWLSLLEDNHDEVAEMTSLPVLQGMLERMESMAGRIVANELMAVAEKDGYGALDEIGRERLRKICEEFHRTCVKVNREQELENLHWRVQAIATEQK